MRHVASLCKVLCKRGGRLHLQYPCYARAASYSTASDLVRVGLASNGSINGDLAGGMVMSLLTLRDSGIVVAVLSNIAHANTSALGLKIGDAFAKQAR